jgi:ligand-binding SRPBCC domain-containing protein
VRWLARITEFVWNSHFCDEQLKGPFRSWKHRHEIVREVRDGVNGTLISDDVEYSLPGGPLGSLVNAVLIRRQMEATFLYRQQRIEEILPVAARQATRRS